MTQDNREIFEIPVVLSLHGRVRIRADSKEQAYGHFGKMSNSTLRQAFKEDYSFKSVANRYLNEKPERNLEEDDGERDDSNIRSPTDISGKSENLRGVDEEIGDGHEDEGEGVDCPSD